jgi:hypothetical protein
MNRGASRPFAAPISRRRVMTNQSCLSFAGWALFAVSALPAQRALLDRLPPDQEAHAPRPPRPTFEEIQAAIELPGGGVLRAMAAVGKRLWIARGEDLLAIDWPDRRVVAILPAPERLLALAADARHLYALRAEEVLVLDGHAGRVVRSMPLAGAADTPAVALAAHAGALHVLRGRELLRLDPRTAAVETRPTHFSAEGVHWLVSDGTSLWAGTKAGCRRVFGDDEVRWNVIAPWSSPMHSSVATVVDGVWIAHLCCRERGIEFATTGLMWWPVALPEERLSLKLHTDGGRIRYEVGPTPVRDEVALKAELARLLGATVPWPDGAKKPMPVVIEPYPGVKIRDVTQAWDAAVSAGFPDVACPRLEAWARAMPPPPAKPPARANDKR